MKASDRTQDNDLQEKGSTNKNIKTEQKSRKLDAERKLLGADRCKRPAFRCGLASHELMTVGRLSERRMSW